MAPGPRALTRAPGDRTGARRALLAAIACLPIGLSLACKRDDPRGRTSRRGITIGLCMDKPIEGRWQRDRDLFVARATASGAQVLVEAADGSAARQSAQAESLLARGVDVLVVIPHDTVAASHIVESAHRARVPVIAYDRMISDADLDLYVSFDGVRVGEIQAGWLIERKPRGRYAIVGGPEEDHNAVLVHTGQMNVLEPHVQRGDVVIVTDQWANAWHADEGRRITREALGRSGRGVDAVLASDDDLAGGAIEALREHGLLGKVLVTGQDADLAACRRIAAGTQGMTVYKPIRRLAEAAADAALAVARRQQPAAPTRLVGNGRRKVPSILLAPMASDRGSLQETVVADGFHARDEIFGARIPSSDR